jgi:hypothetical protein
VSLVCVFNDPDVLHGCLQTSFERLTPTAPESQLIAVDNTTHAFTSAGSALMHGAEQAQHEVVAMVHQDVVLHSLTALEEAAGLLLETPDIGLLGACGISADGSIRGRIRDRVVLIGDPASTPTEVDSVDEVLFMVRASDLLEQPLSSAPDLSWHAYAVEYGLRQKQLGRRVVAAQIPITHNSLTINLARLDVAHAFVATQYPEHLPLRTTCGVVRSPVRPGRVARLTRPHRWRYRWLEESVSLAPGILALGRARTVLADIRLDVDDLIASTPDRLHIRNLDDGAFGGSDSPFILSRRGRPVSVATVRAADLTTAICEPGAGGLLVTNLQLDDLRPLASACPSEDTVLGFARDTGYWVLVGPAASLTPPQWDTPRSRPATFGLKHGSQVLRERVGMRRKVNSI